MSIPGNLILQALPFEFDSYEVIDTFRFTFYGCRFRADFGKFVPGDYAEKVVLDLILGTVICSDWESVRHKIEIRISAERASKRST